MNPILKIILTLFVIFLGFRILYGNPTPFNYLLVGLPISFLVGIVVAGAVIEEEPR